MLATFFAVTRVRDKLLPVRNIALARNSNTECHVPNYSSCPRVYPFLPEPDFIHSEESRARASSESRINASPDPEPEGDSSRSGGRCGSHKTGKSATCPGKSGFSIQSPTRYNGGKPLEEASQRSPLQRVYHRSRPFRRVSNRVMGYPLLETPGRQIVG